MSASDQRESSGLRRRYTDHALQDDGDAWMPLEQRVDIASDDLEGRTIIAFPTATYGGARAALVS